MSIDLLEEYIESGNGPGMERLLSSRPSLASEPTSHGISPLLLCCYYQKPQLADIILKRVEELPLFEAAALGVLEVVSAIVEDDPSALDRVSDHGFSALALASEFGQIEVLRYLLAKHADPNQPSQNGYLVYPLHTAISGNNIQVAKMLLEANAEVNVMQSSRQSPLHLAAQSGNIDLIILLLEYGADVELKNDQGQTPSDLAAERGHVEIAAILRI
ncbi:MAG TPA: ankyrin repeat domain-containing protein [Sphingobacteriaceae bacterium]|nr:ankyrin repeat domain-containing protein [Sphingobacteriaceae bacterium]